MNTYVAVLELLLAAVFAVAAYGKLTDRAGARTAMREFGVPEALAFPVALALPVLEIVIAIGLVIEPTSRAAAIAALLLLGAFVAGIAWQVAHNRAPDCHCFGQIHSEPAGWPTIWRNAGLMLLALAIAIHGGIGIAQWLDGQSELEQLVTMLGVVGIGGGALVWRQLTRLIEQQANLISRASVAVNGVPETAAPAESGPRRFQDFTIATADGGTFSPGTLLERKLPLVMLFTSPSCAPCEDLMPDIREWQRRYANRVSIALIGTGELSDNQRKFAHYGITNWGVQNWPEASEIFDVNGTPSAVAIMPDGTIPEASAVGRDEIRAMISALVNPEEVVAPVVDGIAQFAADGTAEESVFVSPNTGLSIGARVPDLPLPTPEGSYVSLADMTGHDYLLLFYSSSCGFCSAMLPDLVEMQDELNEQEVRLVIAATGDPNALREAGLQFPIVIDQGHAYLGKRLAIVGTPVAFQIDAEGRIASEGIVGGPPILDFLDEKLPVAEEPTVV